LVLPEPMLLPFEQHVRKRQVLLPASLDERLRLVWRDDLVFRALEENHRTFHVVGEMNRRALPVDVRALRIRTDQRLAVTRLELVRLLDEELEVTDPVMARAGGVEVATGQREADCEAARPC